MATRSFIGIENSDGSVDYVYCHFDGYIDSVGKDVVKLSRGEIRKIINAGDMQSFGEHYRDVPRVPKFTKTVDLFWKQLGEWSTEYVYLCNKHGTWYVKSDRLSPTSLKTIMKNAGIDF